MNGLWVVSLALTLFSAIMGVLAKAWLARFVPVTTSREANYKDALLRFKLDQQAEYWHLEEVLTVIPLLVQIASFLFFVGLIIQVKQDNDTLGITLITFCVAGGLVYFTMTVLPLWSPTAPFNTPVSDTLIWFRNIFWSLRSAYSTGTKKNPWDSIPATLDDNWALAEILHTKLLKSPKSLYVDEAIAEIATIAFRDNWVGHLARNGAVRLLLARFRQLASTRTTTDVERQLEILCIHMLALLRFVHHYELTIVNKSIADSHAIHELGRDLRAALQDPSSPLRRWNTLPDSLRPLLFALRAQIMTMTSSPGTTVSASHTLDFTPNELQDRPWDIAFRDIRSSHRLPFALAACRGLAYGEQNLRTISAFLMSITLAKGLL